MKICEEKTLQNMKDSQSVKYEIMNNKRNDVYDIARGVGIVLVVIGHMHHFFSYDSNIYMFIYNFHVPLFIFLSGCVFQINRIMLKEYLDKRFREIIVPYVFAAILSILYMAPMEEGNSYYFNSILIGNTYNGNLSYNVPLWYCPMIFVALMIFYLFVYLTEKFCNKHTILFGLVFLSYLFGYYLVRNGIRLPWSIETSLCAQIYLFIGYKLKKYIRNQYGSKEYKFFVVALFMVVSIYVNTYKLNGRVDMNSGLYNNIVLYAFNAVLGIYVVMLFSILIRRFCGNGWRLFAFLGKNSLYIMIFHRLAFDFAQGEIVRYMPKVIAENMWNSNVIGVSYWLIICIAFSLFLGKVYRMVFGNFNR